MIWRQQVLVNSCCNEVLLGFFFDGLVIVNVDIRENKYFRMCFLLVV